jgi:hypothetical protein
LRSDDNFTPAGLVWNRLGVGSRIRRLPSEEDDAVYAMTAEISGFGFYLWTIRSVHP